MYFVLETYFWNFVIFLKVFERSRILGSQFINIYILVFLIHCLLINGGTFVTHKNAMFIFIYWLFINTLTHWRKNISMHWLNNLAFDYRFWKLLNFNIPWRPCIYITIPSSSLNFTNPYRPSPQVDIKYNWPRNTLIVYSYHIDCLT